jgi:bacteriocin biosynthesis cyclodehydratase domain-containing protein
VQSLYVIVTDAFAAAVAAALRSAAPDGWQLRTVTRADLDRLPAADAYVFPRGRIARYEEEELDRFVRTRGAILLPLVLDLPVLRAGPLGRSGLPCSACFLARAEQHAGPGRAGSDAVVEAHYRAHPHDGTLGVLPAHAALAAALAVDALRPDSAREPGAVLQVDLLTLRTSLSRTVGIHNCPRCGTGRAEEERGYTALLPLAASVAAEISGQGA